MKFFENFMRFMKANMELMELKGIKNLKFPYIYMVIYTIEIYKILY